MCMWVHLLAPVPLGVTVRYEQPNYNVSEEDGSVTLALVLGGEASNNTSVPVTVTVRTLDLLNSSYGDAANGELLEFCFLTFLLVWPDTVCNEFVKGLSYAYTIKWDEEYYSHYLVYVCLIVSLSVTRTGSLLTWVLETHRICQLTAHSTDSIYVVRLTYS